MSDYFDHLFITKLLMFSSKTLVWSCDLAVLMCRQMIVDSKQATINLEILSRFEQLQRCTQVSKVKHLR